MQFDNTVFTDWLTKFEKALIEAGMPAAQALKYRGAYWQDALQLFMDCHSPETAAVHELLGPAHVTLAKHASTAEGPSGECPICGARQDAKTTRRCCEQADAHGQTQRG
jgi:hypothetical protein